MAKREKRVVHTGVTSEQMEAAFAEYAAADASLEKIAAEIDLKVTAIREKYADKQAQLSEKKEKSFDVIQAFSIENRDVLFSKRKSIEGSHGTYGFRTGTPALKTLKGFTWASVTKLLKEFYPGYVRTAEEPMKDKLLADRENEGAANMFEKIGICVKQDESFFIDLKKEAV
jgi:phage host-nuclease inhibitor protein Gam